MGVLDYFSLADRVALVTGAAGGLGSYQARAMAEAGATVIAADRDHAGAERVAAAIVAAGGTATATPLDVTDAASVDALVAQTVARHGRIDVLINSAGINRRVAAEELSLEDWDTVLDVNLRGVFLCCQRVGRVMLAQGSGSIVSVASQLGGRAGAFRAQTAYGTSKAGVIALTRELGVQWAQRGVRVNAVGPALFRTPLTEALWDDPAMLDREIGRIPMGRTGEYEDLAGVTVFLASDAARFLTGQTIFADGGYMAT